VGSLGRPRRAAPTVITAMPNPKRSLVIAILVLLLGSSVASAQEREKAIELLQSLATQLGTLQSPENRARIGANIADSLWPHDEKRARALFISIEEDINWGLRVRENKSARHDNSPIVFMKLRLDTVERIAKRDAELALDFLRATVPTYEKRYEIARERDFEVKLASQIAASNPDLALKIGRESLKSGISDELLHLLKRLHKNHREHGVTLYKETIQKLRDSNFSIYRTQVDFTRSLADFLQPPAADEAAFRDLLNMLVTAATANGCGKPNMIDEAEYFCDQVRDLLPGMQKIAPLQAAQLKHLAVEGKTQSWRTTNSRYDEMRRVLEMGDIDEMLEFARQFPEFTSTIYWRATIQARDSGDLERARKIANDASNPELKKQLLSLLKDSEEPDAVTDEQLAKIQIELNKITDVDDRIRHLAQAANRIGAKSRAAALKLLDQASGMLESEKPGKDQVLAQLALSLLYCVEKSDRGLALMEASLPKLNELIDAAAKLDGFDTHYMRDGEWNMSKDGTLGEILTFLSLNAAPYAWCDFDRAVSLAGQFERNEIRIMAQVKLAQSILAGPPRRFRL
ncbi:MAG TPA: hypothetical protein VFS90_19500, partial [Pyrinomonadaceae bacterium]|nr:hypothetical protein [Pyrinomonadaceae bacterium]